MEGIGKRFDEERLLSARTKTWDAVSLIAESVRPGQTESEAIKRANSILADMGVRRFWHRTHIRFGRNTILGYEDSYDAEVHLAEDDVFYVDIGPVFDDHEGDAGTTFVLGGDPEKLALQRDARVIFERTQDQWLRENTNGPALYEYASKIAQELGWLLNPPYVRGHRISDFPHSIHHGGSLQEFGEHPRAERWVLEIQIRHPTKDLGAFHEDILLGRNKG